MKNRKPFCPYLALTKEYAKHISAHEYVNGMLNFFNITQSLKLYDRFATPRSTRTPNGGHVFSRICGLVKYNICDMILGDGLLRATSVAKHA